MNRNAMTLALTLTAVAAMVPTEAGAQQAIEERRLASADGTVKITNAAGRVRVLGWARDSVAVTGRLGAGAERLEFSTAGRETRIRVVVPRDSHTVGETDLEVRVPRQSHVAVRSSAAGIEVQGVNGALDLESVSGGIHVTGRPRMVYAESAGGDVVIDASTKVIRAKSVNGDVTVLGARGYLEVSTVSGNARIVGQDAWEGEVTSVSGDIHFEGDFQSGATFYFETHSGRVELVLPTDIAADFDLTTIAGGRVENQFAPAAERSFSTGGGGTLIKIKSFKGPIRIRKRE